MEKALLIIDKKGSTLIEALLAVAVFGMFVTAIVGGLVDGNESTLLAGQRQRAAKVAEECEEVARGLRDGSYSNLSNGTYGLTLVGGHWTLSVSPDTLTGFTRSITIADGVTDQKVITCNVGWNQNLQRSGNISLVSYLSNWREAVVALKRKGMLVYGDGGTTSDAIKYQLYDDNTSTWSAASATADVDVSSANKHLRAVKVYSSSTRNEKIVISRHYNGTAQFIYAQVWNGTTWGNVIQLSTWSSATYLDTQNFDGTYLLNGNFMAVFSDNTLIPKTISWNGSSWSGVSSITSLGAGQIPTYIGISQRAGTNEAMACFYTQAMDTLTEYYNGTSWSAVTSHATNAPVATKKLVDFKWANSDATKGVLLYTAATNDKAMTSRTFTANGTGSGSWGTAAKYGTNQTSNIGSLYLSPVTGTNNFVACDKDATATPLIICSRLSTTGWVAGSHVTVAAATDTGIQQSSAIGFESTGLYGTILYSDNTTAAKLKKFTISSNTWDSAATTVNAVAAGIMKTIRVEPNPTNNDQMFFATDANLDLYSIIWDGTSHSLYASPSSKAWLGHGTNGSAATAYWYDFAWDEM